MTSWKTDVAGLLGATAAGLGLNVLFKHLFSDEEVEGFPRWRWLLAAVVQGTALPATLGLALYHNGGLTLQWLLQPWDGFRRPLYTRSYLYALFASQSRDISQTKNRLLFVHHLVVMATSAGALALSAAPGLFTFGTALLEFGSFFYNLYTLYPDSPAIKCAYHCLMPVTNIGALGLGVVLYREQTPLNAWVKGAYLSCLVGVCYGRHRHQMIDLGWWRRRPHRH
eukprot:EG_transcript_25333